MQGSSPHCLIAKNNNPGIKVSQNTGYLEDSCGIEMYLAKWNNICNTVSKKSD